MECSIFNNYICEWNEIHHEKSDTYSMHAHGLAVLGWTRDQPDSTTKYLKR